MPFDSWFWLDFEADMSQERPQLAVSSRERLGSSESRRLRRQGLVPGVLYGNGEPRHFTVDVFELRRVLSGSYGLNAILDVVVDGTGGPHHAVLKEYQLDPLRSTLSHIDLHEVRLDRPIQTQVAVELVGVPVGVSMGGLLQQIVREITVEALPMQIPERFELDVSDLAIGDSIQLSAVSIPPDVSLLDDPETTVASVVVSRRALAEEEEGVAEGEEAAEGEEVVAGEEPAAAEAEAGPGGEAEAEAAAEES